MEPIKAIATLPQREQNALSVRGTERALTVIELEQFDSLCDQMQAYYPHQEFGEETVRGFMFDLERLAVIHGIDALKVALLNLRIKPGQRFFPHPSEVAAEIEQEKEARQKLAREQRRIESERNQRTERHQQFWKWAAEFMHDTGIDEMELLNRFPGMRGTKPTDATGDAMNRTAHDDETAVADKMAQTVAKQAEIYVRRRCRKCAIVTGGFTTSTLSDKRTCRALVRGGFIECGGDMEEIWRGKI
jgi:hypothetical protein